ncbi:hypothetical protein Tco_0911342 [Tanacetum coccineum]|uniref:Reverse transcriptase domain-containing protein n=1 Tax=Tanacetum coccineum TaxID=301880 RepID=A0ABQ5CY56_9ASTR
MPPMIITRSAGRPAVASRGGGPGRRAGSGDSRTRGHSGDQGNGRDDGSGGQVGSQGSEVNGGVDGVLDFSTIIAQQLQNLLATIVAQVGDQGRGQGNGRDQNGDAVNDNIGVMLVGVNSKIRTRGREAAVGMSWEDFKTLTREEFCPSNEMQKLETEMWNHAMVRASRVAYTDRFHGWLATEPKTIQKVVQLVGTLTDEALRNGSIKKNHEKRGNGGEPSKDRNGRRITRGLE